ncbi:MAG: hypothetical protein RBT15_01930 [Gudongella sp.]|jgi:hypothetical protein|nr:hypothetical protein [Gudongella sp.]
MKKKSTYEDDGRVIADMNFEGAPWYVEKKNESKAEFIGDNEPMTKKEMFLLMRYAVGAGLAIAMVFVIAFFLFILFSLKIWFRV